jgi:hypothetical protein
MVKKKLPMGAFFCLKFGRPMQVKRTTQRKRIERIEMRNPPLGLTSLRIDQRR